MSPENVFLFHAAHAFHERIPQRVPELTIVDEDSFLDAGKDLVVQLIGLLEFGFYILSLGDVGDFGSHPDERSVRAELRDNRTVNPGDFIRPATTVTYHFVSYRLPGFRHARAWTHRKRILPSIFSKDGQVELVRRLPENLLFG